MKKKIILVSLLGFFASPLLFASSQGFINTPILDIIDYFAGLQGYFLSIALKLGRVLALAGFAWSCLMVVAGTKKMRDVLVGTMGKWLMFFLILECYPGFCLGLRNVSTAIGRTASGSSDGYPVINQQITKYIDSVKKFLSASAEDAIALAEKMKLESDSVFEQRRAGIRQVYQNNYVGTELRNLDDDLLALEQEQKAKNDKIDKKIKKNEAKAEKRILKFLGQIDALKDFLIVDGQSDLEHYKVDISLKTAGGKDTGYISPSSVLRIVLLVVQISWEREWWISGSKLEKNGIGRSTIKLTDLKIGGAGSRKLLAILLLGITALLMIIVACAVLIQYVMAIIEYAIITSAAVILVPMMLFDGTKDMFNKILPSLFAQAMKLMFIVLSMVWVIVSFIQMGQNLLVDTKSFGFIQFAYILLNLILIFAISSNAPKLAATLLTGSPQMSMGEFMGAVGGIIAAGKAVDTAGGVAKKVAGKTVTTGTTAVGSGAKAIGAAKKAYQNAQSNGASGLKSVFSGAGAAAGSIGSDIATSAGNTMNNWSKGNVGTISKVLSNAPSQETPSSVAYTGNHGNLSESKGEFIKRKYNEGRNNS